MQFTVGMTETPSAFNSKSPNALVTASWPDTLPFKINPLFYLNNF